MNFRRAAFYFVCVCPLLAQAPEFGGPSILSRGVTPTNRLRTPLAFRPFVGVNGVYDNGLVPLSVDSSGNIPTTGAVGVEAQMGAYAYHATQKTTIGLDYRGAYRHYNKHTYYDGLDQFLTLDISHQPTRRLQLDFKEGAGTFTRSFGYMTFLSGSFTDPAYYANTPTNLFDNRINYLTSSASMTYQQTARLSYYAGASGFAIDRQSSSLYGVTGVVARGGAAYRITRYSTIGLAYDFMHFGYSKAFGGSDMHSVMVDYSIRLTRRWELALLGGVTRLEALAVAQVTIDPAVAAILGQNVGYEALYRLEHVPRVEARLTRHFRHALMGFQYVRGVSPGNGIYLTSEQQNAAANYTYTGLRRWNFGANLGYYALKSYAGASGHYQGYAGGFGVTRSLSREKFYVVLRCDARRYDVTGTGTVPRNMYRATLGVTYSPGDTPLALW